jgi:hypothetical protein
MVSRPAEQIKPEAESQTGRKTKRRQVLRGPSEVLARTGAHGEMVVEVHRVNNEGAAGAEARAGSELGESRTPFRYPADHIEANRGARLRSIEHSDWERNLHADHGE